MVYSYSKKNGGLKVYLMDNGRTVSDFEFSKEECKELYANLCEVLFDDILEKNKDVLYRLKNNIPAPKMVSLYKVCEWLNNNLIDYWSRQNGHPATFINDFKRAMEE